MADIYRALDDETRRLILDELVQQNGQTLFALCAVLTTKHGLSSSRQAISQHLAVLESAGLVKTARQGRTKLHYFNTEPLAVIAERWRLPERREDT
jgi:DNA-binding transcriptional ArsR family regulator